MSEINLIDEPYYESLDDADKISYLLDLVVKYGAVYYRAHTFLEQLEQQKQDILLDAQALPETIRLSKELLELVVKEDEA